MATAKCGFCLGSGKRKEYDGVGGSWYERCWQCNGRGVVDTMDDAVTLSASDIVALRYAMHLCMLNPLGALAKTSEVQDAETKKSCEAYMVLDRLLGDRP